MNRFKGKTLHCLARLSVLYLDVKWEVRESGLAKKRNRRFYVIPAKAGIQEFQKVTTDWIPAFAGMTTFCECIRSQKSGTKK
jgi:hypothetical protein